MTRYFTRERFGRPQFLAGLLLLAFLAQASWLVLMDSSIPSVSPRFYGPEEIRVVDGSRQWHGQGIAGAPYPNGRGSRLDGVSEDGFDLEHSPLIPLISAAPIVMLPQRWWDAGLSDYGRRLLLRLPFLAIGVFLGASLWYVARRLCGNTGGFIALTLYCFSPAMIQASAVWHTEPEILVAWGSFGTIFTAIAVAHTLYAPREVVLWNWRRIVLLGVSLAIAVGSQFSMIVLAPMALAFLLYVAPVRRRAGVAIWIAGCAVGFALLFAAYFFQVHAFVGGLRHAVFWGATWRAFGLPGVYKQVGMNLGRACPALALTLPVALAIYAAWRRTRYFGNTAPLLVGATFLILGMAHPHQGGAGFFLAAIPFLFIFVSGVLADLMETRYRALVSAGVLGMLGAYVVWCVLNLALVGRG